MATLSIRLNKRVVIQSRDTGQDAYGEPLNTWTNVFDTPDGKIAAEVKSMSGRQYFAANAAQNPVTTQITVRRYSQAILPAMRVVDGSDIYDIEAVLKQLDGTLLLMCVSGLSNG
jgi:SPP1 family predicted phage head-tail adaptor